MFVDVVWTVYMTVHQQDSSQPQQSHDSPHLGAVGLTMVEMEEATLAGILESGCGEGLALERAC